MYFYTKKWHDYVNDEYAKFLIESKASYYIVKLNDRKELIGYSYDLLKEKFDIYYQNKKKYVESYSYLEQEFDLYEKIELLSYEEEFENFKKRFECYYKRLQEEAIEYVQKANDNYVTIKDVERTDFRLIALNLSNDKYYALISKLTLTNEVMGFLTGKSKNAKEKDKLAYKKLDDIWFHDSKILEIKWSGDDIIVILHDNETYCKIVMVNGNTNIDLFNHFSDYVVVDYQYGYYEDTGYYLKLDELEFWADDIIVNRL